ncbi:RlpA-like double-psi beta-barrel-protein domain-containing protein-containing protein [Pterulicium gracile]|uniref:cellulase n=1 Tax=Pterulicium gracile TaxID=1884261 RepID=A0A5C3QDP7_9AGAR|nr:RlpA-like double-psi beta-barrel-protein domain-containing protein-containing protein [Pterula gracilis]
MIESNRDCCKPSCSWSGKADVNTPVRTCNRQGTLLTDPNAVSGCDGGDSFTCTNMSPWIVDDNTAYGFAAVNIAGGNERTWCCECYELAFTSGPVAGKKMIVQATNTGGDLGHNHFDIMMPGGGLGWFTHGCPAQFGSWDGGAQYGGVANRDQCYQLPCALVKGCLWRFDWFQNADNPSVNFKQVTCPTAITNVSGCTRRDAGKAPAQVAPGGTCTGA